MFNWERALDKENKITCWDIDLSEEKIQEYQEKGFIRKEGDLLLLDHPSFPVSVVNILPR